MSDFDQLYNEILTSTGKEKLLSKFSELQTDRERVELALVVLEDYTVRRHYSSKNEAEAVLCRDQGDIFNSKGESMRAIAMYSSAIRLSPCGSLTLVRSYAARSTLLHQQEFYTLALQDAEQVIQLECQEPATVETIKLLTMVGSCYQNKCKWDEAERTYQQALTKLRESQMNNESKAVLAVELIQRLKQTKQREKQKTYGLDSDCLGDEEKHVPEVDYGRNVKFPSCSTAVSLQWSKEKGRRMVAEVDIKIGSVVIVEEPYAWSLSREALGEHCLHCCCFVVAQIPCNQCSTVGYCSTTCRDLSWQACHRFECEILGHFLDSKQLSIMALVVYRIILNAAFTSIVPNESPKINTMFAELHNPSVNNQHITEQILGKDYKPVFDQITNSSSRTSGDLLKRAVSSVFLVRCLQKVLGGIEDEVTVATALLRHLQSCSCNAYQINEQLVPDGNIREAEGIELGGAVYPTVSLTNHSCNPNIVRHSYGNVCVVRALRPIKKNEELLDNYGTHFLSHTYEERQDLLKRLYSFQCMCEACAGRWPTGDALQKQATQYKCTHCNKNIGHSLINCTQCKRKYDSKKTVKKLQEMSKNYKTGLECLLKGQVKDCLEICIKYAVLLESVVEQPNIELVRCQQTITQCWSLLANVDNRRRKVA